MSRSSSKVIAHADWQKSGTSVYRRCKPPLSLFDSLFDRPTRRRHHMKYKGITTFPDIFNLSRTLSYLKFECTECGAVYFGDPIEWGRNV